MIRRICKRTVEVIKQEWEWFQFRLWLQRRAIRWAR